MRRPLLVILLTLATIPARAQTPAQDEGPVLTRHRVNVRDWTVRVEIRLNPDRRRHAVPVFENRFFIPETERIQFRRARFAFPILARSAMHETYLDRQDSFTRIRGKEVVRGSLVEPESRPEEARVEMALGPVNIQDNVTFQVEYPMTSFETRIDEGRAFSIPWPKDEWPSIAKPYLGSQSYIDPDAPEVTALVEEWTKGNPRNAKPYYLAKYLAGRVLEHYMPTEGTYREVRSPFAGRLIGEGDRSGFIVEGSTHAARVGQGPEHDLANLLVAVYRSAGLPARLVVGLDPEETDEQRFPVTRAWAEFFLYDERADRGEWIPVDIMNQRAFSSKAPPIDIEWRFFGRNERFDFTVPIAARWEPIEDALRAHSGPAFYGWSTTPAPQIVRQEVRIWAHETPMKPGLEELERRRERSRPPRNRE